MRTRDSGKRTRENSDLRHLELADLVGLSYPVCVGSSLERAVSTGLVTRRPTPSGSARLPCVRLRPSSDLSLSVGALSVPTG